MPNDAPPPTPAHHDDRRPSRILTSFRTSSSSLESVSSTSRMRRRFSSLLSSPVRGGLFHSKKKSISEQDDLVEEEQVSFSSSDSDHQLSPQETSPSSPNPILSVSDKQQAHALWLDSPQGDIWIVSPSEKNQYPSRPFIHLADQVRHILGSTLDEVDEEIEQEWESHRRELHNLLYPPSTRKPIF
ncbi:hypothetical protein EC973_008998 [Apophysomyces ossiformis]|uniref:Uncharacterized protein n=1 Tax=Apophysomyces ossiformis TaxID=679940 RepID=A0A8H7BS18_9FUNG|nr:hypothetical protein EC973_008998 [Apophysomyces ossiformis]